ncbi:MAG: ABC transporter substrate-binding protein, partial [Acetobacteraceae bacterium]|nr:ABC transporter substrate-binding protein [Acetobacteraceae bacterium]
DEILKAAFFGRGAIIEGLPLPEGTPFYNPGLAHGLGYDQAKARTLLSAAGIGSGFSCKLLATAQYGMHKDTAAVIQQHLGEIGIAVELLLPDWATRVTLGNRGQYEIGVMGSSSDSNDPDGLAPFLDGSLSPSYNRSYGYNDPKINALLAAGRAAFDPAKRLAIYDELQRVCLEQVPMIGLCFRAQGYGMAKALTGFRNMPGALSFYSGTTFEDASTG